MIERIYDRRAITLVEVTFAIGAVTIGLLALLSILPIADRRAQEAINMSTAAEMGDAVLNELQSRKLLTGRKLSELDGKLLDYDVATATIQTNVTGTVGTLAGGFCIDPIFKAKLTAVPTPSFQYDATQFPYYTRNFDPLTNPSSTGSLWLSGPPPPTDLPPRLMRVGFSPSSTVTAAGKIEQAKATGERLNDLVTSRPKDRSLDATLTSLTSGTSLAYGKRVPSGEFSWIATVSPLQGNLFASVSIVILRQRDSEFEVPAATTTEPDENGVSERLAYVASASGFKGGAGGTVIITGSNTTLSKLVAGQWMMLSRRVSTSPVFHVHRWYRIAGLNGKAQPCTTDGTSTTADTVLKGKLPTAAGTQVWFHTLLLDGPDWNFGFDTPDFGDDTFATIMDGVVSVTERTVRLEDF